MIVDILLWLWMISGLTAGIGAITWAINKRFSHKKEALIAVARWLWPTMPADGKPKGTYQCLACGKLWDGSELFDDPMVTGRHWTCGDLFCGASVRKVSDKAGKC
ncbi:unnamed protein product [marine sediment metagenome]|uniref:Uncharacterized protein n=1 Tax=marine sediment metagenome TaxID=412755 RepID=X0WH75_9ZZZZ